MRIGGGRCPGSLKSGTIIIQGGQLTAGGGGEDRWREGSWYHKKWNHYNSRRKANCRGRGEDRWREVSWYHKKWNHYNSRRTAKCRVRGEDRWMEVFWCHKKWNLK